LESSSEVTISPTTTSAQDDDEGNRGRNIGGGSIGGAGAKAKLKLKHTFSVLEAPVGYKEYKEVTLLSSKMRTKVDVVLALSEEKVEVHPLKHQANTMARLWKSGKQKSVCYATEDLVACEVVEKRSNGRCLIRLVMAISFSTEEAIPSSLPMSSTTSAENSQFEFKHHDFECSEVDAVEVSHW